MKETLRKRCIFVNSDRSKMQHFVSIIFFSFFFLGKYFWEMDRKALFTFPAFRFMCVTVSGEKRLVMITL